MCSLFLVLCLLITTAVRSIKKKTHQRLLLWEVSVMQQRPNTSRRLSVISHRLYKWARQQKIPAARRSLQLSQSEELHRLKAELKRVLINDCVLRSVASAGIRQLAAESGSEFSKTETLIANPDLTLKILFKWFLSLISHN